MHVGSDPPAASNQLATADAGRPPQPLVWAPHNVAEDDAAHLERTWVELETQALAEPSITTAATSAGGSWRGPAALVAADESARGRFFRQLEGTLLDGRYAVSKLLGFGGMGAVYLARDAAPDLSLEKGGRFRTADDTYALKVHVPVLGQPDEHKRTDTLGGSVGRVGSTARFIRECRLQQRNLSESRRVLRAYSFGTTRLELQHLEAAVAEFKSARGDKETAPRPPAHGIGADRAVLYYFTMDIAPGGALPVFEEPQPIEMVAALALELLAAIDEIHARSVVHRDLNNANVLLSSPWEQTSRALLHAKTSGHHQGVAFPKVMLGDFGIARHGAMRNDSPLGQVLGTPAFLPPEAFTLGNLDPQADLYAAGVVLYLAATGRHPVTAAGYRLRDALLGRCGPLKSIRELVAEFPEALDLAIMQLLAADPRERTATAALAHDAFADWWHHAETRVLEMQAAPTPRGQPTLSTPHFVGRGPQLTAARAFLDATLHYHAADELTGATPWLGNKLGNKLENKLGNKLGNHHDATAGVAAAAPGQLPSCIMTICGPPGAGKSRLLAEVVRSAQSMNATVLQGQCISGIGAALQSFGPVLRDIDALAADPTHVPTANRRSVPVAAPATQGEQATSIRAGGGAQADLPADATRTTGSDSASVAAAPARAGRSSRSSRSSDDALAYEHRLLALERVPTAEDPDYEVLRSDALTFEDERVRAAAQRRLQMQQAAAQLLRVARRRPLVIVQEDSQWSDESSTALLEYCIQGVALARAAGHPARVAFVLTHRPQEPGNAVARIEQVLAQQQALEAPAVRLEMGGFDAPQVCELAASLLRTKETRALRELCGKLFPKPQTPPLYVEQALRVLVEDGALTHGAFDMRPDGATRWRGVWNFEQAAQTESILPASVHEAVGRHAEHLSAGTAKLLAFAAATGRLFDLDVVADAAGYDALEALDFLDEAASAGFISHTQELDIAAFVSRTRERRFSFAHDRYREAIEAAMQPRARQSCHGKLARAIVAVRGDNDANAEELSRHYEGAGNQVEAFRQAYVAARYSQSEHAYDRAVDLYARACALADPAGVMPTMELRDGFARAAISAGRYDEATRQLDIRRHEPSLPATERWDAALRLAEIKHRRLDYHGALPPLEELLASIGERIPASPGGRTLAVVKNLPFVLAGGLWPRCVRRRDANDPALEAVRCRAWYTLFECGVFVDFNTGLWAGSHVGRRAVTSGYHAFSPPMFAVWAFVFGAQGPHALSRAYGNLAQEFLAKSQTEAGAAHAAAKDAATRALTHFLLLSGRMCRGELHPSVLAAASRDIGDGMRAARQSGDPQRQWMILAVAAALCLETGRIRHFSSFYEGIVTTATSMRVRQLVDLYTAGSSGEAARARGDYAGAAAQFENFTREAAAAGDKMQIYLGQALRNWSEALGGATGSDGSSWPQGLAARALEALESWLQGRFALPTVWPISQSLATLALCALHEPGLSQATHKRIARLRRLCRKACLAHRIETPLYLGACAAMDLAAGADERAAAGFAKAIDVARRDGTVMLLLEVYRLAARAYARGSDEQWMYAWLDHELTRRIDAAPPPPSQEELFAGNLGDPVQPPWPADWPGSERTRESSARPQPIPE